MSRSSGVALLACMLSLGGCGPGLTQGDGGLSWLLSVEKAGTGSGVVSASPGRIYCGPSCSGPLARGIEVTLEARPDAGSIFTGWTGECAGTGPCTFPIRADTTVGAGFALTVHSWSAQLTGDGDGVITTSPPGIDCGTACTASFAYGTRVTFTATPAPGSHASSWGAYGPGCQDAGAPCSRAFDVTGPGLVRATFSRLPTPTFAVNVGRAGTGSGSVTSGGLDCEFVNCVSRWPVGSTVEVVATAASGSTFDGWTGDVIGTSPNISLVSDATVTANFTITTRRLTIVKTGAAGGTITSSPAGIDCGTDCSEDFPFGTVARLSAAPAPDAGFEGWTSASCPSLFYCPVTLTSDTTIGATFEPIYRVGNFNQFAQSAVMAPNIATAQQVDVPNPVVVRGLGIITTTSANLTLGLYADASDAPGALLAKTATRSMNAGPIELDLESGFRALPAGKYWIAAIFGNSPSVGRETPSPALTSIKTQGFVAFLPDPFGGAPPTTGQSFNYYLITR